MTNYYPTPADARRIMRFKRAGVANSRIAEILRISLDQLEEMYPVELGFTDEEDLADVADIALNMAKSGEHPKMTMWWLAVKGGWNPNNPPAQPNASPLQIILADGTEIIEGEITDAEFKELPSGSSSDQDEDWAP